MRVGIIGAGAMGGWFGVRLARAGCAVAALDRGATLDALRSGPWRLELDGETLEARVAASSEPGELGEQDLVIVTLKGPALPLVAPALGPMIGPRTVILPVMNGVPWWFLLAGGGELAPTPLASVDPGGVIAAALPIDAVVGGVLHATASVRAPGHVVHGAGNSIVIGEPSGEPRDRTTRIAALLSDAGFDVEVTPAIQQAIWYKLWGNMTMNPISALTGATCDRILDDPLTAALTLRLMAEARAIGARIGAPIEERSEDRNALTRRLGAFKTSMLQDAEAGRALELDQILAAPREIAGRLGLATPDLDAVFGLARVFAQARGLYPQPSGSPA